MSDLQTTGGLIGVETGEAVPKVTADALFTPPKTQTDNGFDFLLNLTKRLEKEDEVTDRLFHKKWIKLSKWYEGEHLGRFDAQNQWRSYQPQMGDPYYVHPELRFHSDAITASWTQSRPDIRILPANDNDETVAAARKADQLVDHYELTLLTEDFLQRESKLAQFTGQMYRYTWWDPTSGPEVPTYEFSDHQEPIHPGGSQCEHCGYMGDADEVECPQCGYPLTATPGLALNIPIAKENGKRRIGDIRTECVPAFQVKVDRSQGVFDCASFLRRRRMVRPEILKQMFTNWEPPTKSSAASSTDDFSLRGERLLQQSTGQPGQTFRPDTLTNPYAGVVINQWWLMPCMYSTRTPEHLPLEFANGTTIPSGARLIELFPDGLYLLVVDNKILDMREECLHEHWQHSPFISIPTRVEGDGIEDLLEPSRQLDDLMSLIYTDIKSNAAPPTVVNTTYGIKTTDVSGKPHWVIPARVPTGERIENAIMQVPGRNFPITGLKFVDMLRAEQQLLAKSFSSATGAPDEVTNGAAGDTATAAQLATSAAQAQRAPELAIRASGNAIWARQILRLFQKNAVDQHYIPLQGRYGLLEGNYFKGADIDADFIITVRNRSWIPRDEFSRRSDLLGFIQAGGLNPQFPRGLREEMAEVFNVSITITSDVADTRLARMRLEQMKTLLPQIEQMAPGQSPILLLQAVPLEPVSDNHTVMASWYIDWLKTDDGLQSPPPLRQTIIGRVQEHQQAAAIQIQQQMALELQAQAPMLGLQQHQAGEGQSMQQKQSLIDSIAFKDLPPEGQVQLAEQAGIKITKAQAEQHIKAQKPAPKPAAKR